MCKYGGREVFGNSICHYLGELDSHPWAPAPGLSRHEYIYLDRGGTRIDTFSIEQTRTTVSMACATEDKENPILRYSVQITRMPAKCRLLQRNKHARHVMTAWGLTYFTSSCVKYNGVVKLCCATPVQSKAQRLQENEATPSSMGLARRIQVLFVNLHLSRSLHGAFYDYQRPYAASHLLIWLAYKSIRQSTKQHFIGCTTC